MKAHGDVLKLTKFSPAREDEKTMKVKKRRRVKLSPRARAILTLAITLAVTLCVGYLGLNGTWLDNQGLYRLLPWLPTSDMERWPQPIALGLDMKGGVYVEYTAAVSEEMLAEGQTMDLLLENTVLIMRDRLAEIGYPEAAVCRLDTEGIRVELPDTPDLASVLGLIGTTAKLEFLDSEGNVFMDGSHLTTASAAWDENRQPAVVLQMNGEGASLFADMTSRSIGKELTITLDGEVLMSRTVDSPITGGGLLLSGSFTAGQAANLALQLKSGALPVQLHQDKQDTISAPLGAKALSTCVTAVMIGILLVFVLMAIRYKIGGFIADWALCIYIILMFILIAIVPGIQLTLPGIAGIILSIIMAVDANCIIFERVKEEFLTGRPILYAVRVGFKNAMSAVLDANIAIIIVSIALLFLGTGGVRGFAVMLLLGVLTSLFTVVVFHRFLMNRMVRVFKNPALYVPGFSKKAIVKIADREAK